MSQLARPSGRTAEGEEGRSACGLRLTGVVCLAAARITLLVAVAVALLGVGIFLGQPSLAAAATGQAAFTLTNGVQSYDDTTPGGLALKELFRATSIVVQSGNVNGLTNVPISLTYGGKPLTGTAALSLTGTFEDATGLLQGTYYYEYDIVYTTTLFGAERQVGAYNGTVEAGLGPNANTREPPLQRLLDGDSLPTHIWGGMARGQPRLGFRLAPCDIHPDRGRARAWLGARGVQRHGQDTDLARRRRHVD